MASSEITLKLGTRGSRLALAQSGQVAANLSMRWPDTHVETVVIKTTGDRLAGPLVDAGGKGLFVKELELALLDGTVDFAVHSYKDVPVTMPLVDDSNLVIASVPRRVDARDVLVTLDGLDLTHLPSGARIGTGSLRRRCQLLAYQQHSSVIDADSRKHRFSIEEASTPASSTPSCSLPRAGVHRAGLFDSDTACGRFPIDTLLPAPGQGALALQCRKADDVRTIEILRGVNDDGDRRVRAC